eukprot:TRINITY_DN2022_c0_g1_i2.p1 TRINITY_DN2022_c0_g1~~TRINITY_DN2022_c0_g1_i2.p1  ORF type:complete len:692 (-),score=206.77 TRINITY_DN2022_c0_g1_i2:236-2110(-)
MKQGGLNTVTTYIPWNLHQPTPSTFDFQGILDLENFIKLADQAGLLVIIRPPPYICNEWEFGGFPAWIMKNNEARLGLRTSQPEYLRYVDAFFAVLSPKLKPYIYANGGPIVAMQVENEYGSFGSDKEYLHHLHQLMLNAGLNVVFFSSNGPSPLMLGNGATDDVLRTVNFGYNGDVPSSLKILRQFQPTGPLFVTELWLGWFDNWGTPHQTRDATTCANTLDAILASGASVNIFMFVGGTNFGFMNGADGDPNSEDPFNRYFAITTSYDYDAPINESGSLTEKYFKLKNVISKYAQVDIPTEQCEENSGKFLDVSERDIPISSQISLWEALGKIGQRYSGPRPLTLEEMDQSYGFVLYRHMISMTGIPLSTFKLNFQELHDRALIFVDRKLVGISERFSNKTVEITLSSDMNGNFIEILAENMGRINYGDYIVNEWKGISQGIRLDYQFLSSWDSWSLPMDFPEISNLNFSTWNPGVAVPAFFKLNFQVEKANDVFIRLPGWMKGIVWVNGFNLGRYWNIGPQLALYCPGPILRPGVNEIIVFEMEKSGSTVQLLPYAVYGMDDTPMVFASEEKEPFYRSPIFIAVMITVAIVFIVSIATYLGILIKKRAQKHRYVMVPIVLE